MGGGEGEDDDDDYFQGWAGLGFVCVCLTLPAHKEDCGKRERRRRDGWMGRKIKEEGWKDVDAQQATLS